MASLFLMVLTMMIIFSIRNMITYTYRMKALDIVSESAKNGIDRGKDWRKSYDLYHKYGSYNSQMFSIYKWTFKQFYPDLHRKLDELNS